MSFSFDIDEKRAESTLDPNNTGIPRTMEHALTYLSNAGKIWQMIDPEKAAKLARMRSHELQYHSSAGYNGWHEVSPRRQSE